MSQHAGIFDDRKRIMDMVRNNRNRIQVAERIEVPEDFFCKCKGCQRTLIFRDVERAAFTCSYCGDHFYMPVNHRLAMLFGEHVRPMQDAPTYPNPIGFPDYEEKLHENQQSSSAAEAIHWGEARMGDHALVYFVMDSAFMMASMGSYVGEQVTRAFEHATATQQPVLGICASGGARMQEGIFSLLQMAKTVHAVQAFQDQGGLYISILTNPTFGGVSASFALIGDINIGEPGALIGFAGPRVIRETIGTALPENFQTAESLMAHGFLDLILDRRDQVATLTKLLALHQRGDV